MTDGAERAIWAKHGAWIRAWVESVASEFEAVPDRTWTGDRVGRLLRSMLDDSDVRFDHFELPPDDPSPDPPSRSSPSEIVQMLRALLEDEVLDVPRLRSLTTRAAAERWSNFLFLALNWAALDRPGVMMQEQSEPDVFDVVYVPIVEGVDESFIVRPDELLPVVGVFTLAYSPTRGRWLVHDFTELSRRPAPNTVPRD